jgi:type I restriction enzyme M protein
MITGRIRNHINAIWDAFWSGGISNPLEVIEQITFPRFLKWLNDLHRTAAGYGVSCELPHLDETLWRSALSQSRKVFQKLATLQHRAIRGEH